MPHFLRVVSAGCETTLTVEEILSVDGVKYDTGVQAPSRDQLANRVVMIETAMAAMHHDLYELISQLVQQDEVQIKPTPTESHEGIS